MGAFIAMPIDPRGERAKLDSLGVGITTLVRYGK